MSRRGSGPVAATATSGGRHPGVPRAPRTHHRYLRRESAVGAHKYFVLYTYVSIRNLRLYTHLSTYPTAKYVYVDPPFVVGSLLAHRRPRVTSELVRRGHARVSARFSCPPRSPSPLSCCSTVSQTPARRTRRMIKRSALVIASMAATASRLGREAEGRRGHPQRG